MKHGWGFLAATALVVSMMVGSARADDSTAIREASDRAAIQALMWRYVRALDSLDADAYAAVFTEDGQFGSGANAVAGRAALKGMVEGLAANRNADSPPMFHVITNSTVEFTGQNSARYFSYWMTVFGPTGDEGSAPRVAAVGRGVDELRRVNGEWLIESRDVAPVD